MYEDVNDVLLWACFDCGASGVLHRPPVVDPEDLARAIARAHAERMPGCARVFRGISVHDFCAHDWLRDAFKRSGAEIVDTPYAARLRREIETRLEGRR
jgi:hypothetical protein